METNNLALLLIFDFILVCLFVFSFHKLIPFTIKWFPQTVILVKLVEHWSVEWNPPGFDPQGGRTSTWDREEGTAFPLQTTRLWCTVETLLTDTLVSGWLYLLPPSQNPFSLNCHSNSVFLHPCKRLAPVMHVFHVLTVSACSTVA